MCLAAPAVFSHTPDGVSQRAIHSWRPASVQLLIACRNRASAAVGSGPGHRSISSPIMRCISASNHRSPVSSYPLAAPLQSHPSPPPLSPLGRASRPASNPRKYGSYNPAPVAYQAGRPCLSCARPVSRSPASRFSAQPRIIVAAARKCGEFLVRSQARLVSLLGLLPRASPGETAEQTREQQRVCQRVLMESSRAVSSASRLRALACSDSPARTLSIKAQTAPPPVDLVSVGNGERSDAAPGSC